MRCIILLGLVALAAAGAPSIPEGTTFYEPKDLDCCCAGCGDPTLVSFDGAAFPLTKTGKFSTSGWGQWPVGSENQEDTCKFGLRLVVKDTLPSAKGTAYYDWVGFGVGVAAKANGQILTQKLGENHRNYLLAQNYKGEFIGAQRGQGFKGVKRFKNLPAVFKQTFRGRTCYWKVEKVNEHFATVRSSCCPYAFNWRPNGVNTCWEFFVASSKYSDGNMSALCGNCNKDNEDDYRTCPGAGSATPYGAIKPVPASMADFDFMTQSCTDASHDGGLYEGGDRLGQNQ